MVGVGSLAPSLGVLAPGGSGRTESGYSTPVIETARVVNVNTQDWTVDAVSEHGNRRFFDIQVMSPYFHYFNGEGWYAMPEVGALCWVCQESTGIYAKRFILGFQAPNDERTQEGQDTQADGFRSNRQNLNPGDMMWRGRDENFVVLRRGGVVQIGSGPATQRIYIPIGGLIRDFCYGYELFSIAGEMKFEEDSTNVTGPDVEVQADAGQVNTRFLLKVKTIANEPEHAVLLTAGSHEDDDKLRLSLEIRPDGAEGSVPVIQLQMDKEGTVTWILEKDFTLSAAGAVTLTADGGDLFLNSLQGAGTLKSKKDMLVQSESGALTLQGKGAALLKGSTATVEGSTIALKGKTQVGGPGGEPVVKGTQLKNLLTSLIKGLTDPAAPFGPIYAPGQPILFPGMTSLLPTLESILSSDNTTT